MNLAKKCLLSAVVATVGFTQVRCTDEEVATFVGVTAIAAGATAIAVAADNDDHHHHHRGGGYRGGRHGGRGPGCSTETENFDAIASNADFNAPSVNAVANEDLVTDENWAATFSMSVESSAKLIASLKSARQGNPAALKDLGLSRNDVGFLAVKKMPSNEGLENLSRSLNQDIVTTRNMMMTLIQYSL